MIKIELNVPVNSFNDTDIKALISEKLSITPEKILKIEILRKSIDARHKDRLCWFLSLAIELSNGCKNLDNYISYNSPISLIKHLDLPKIGTSNKARIAIIGSGPAGLFAALTLIESGFKPIIFERGSDVDNRINAVDLFNKTGELDVDTNVQFGAGGAGTFSDGKINTGISSGYIPIVIGEFLKFGAPAEIKYIRNPHIGTDNLRVIVKSIQNYIVSKGGEFKFNSKVDNITLFDNKITSITANGCDFEFEVVIFAIGHSARDTYELLYKKGIAIEQKAFAIGVRIEHPQNKIDQVMYGKYNSQLPHADYKLSTKLANGRGVYTFCMCPGGEVIAATSEKNCTVTNGMSYFARNKENANSAILVNVNSSDFESNHPLAGIEFQRKYEKLAFGFSKDYKIPVERVCDFLKNNDPSNYGSVKPSSSCGVILADLNRCLPTFVSDGIKEGIKLFDYKIKGFACPDALLSGVETRSSAPIRILRDKITYESLSTSGLFPIGEGSGYAGGIMSSAVDGIKAAISIINRKNEISRK